MKIIFRITFLSALFFTFGCSKDSGDITEEPVVPVVQNRAPLTFNLVAVTNNSVEVDVLPVLSWDAATDPDGDNVTYDLYLTQGAAANELYAENLTATSFEVTERLLLLKEYAFKIVAKDPDGANVTSTTHNFTTRGLRFNDTPVTTSAQFSGRLGHTSVVFDNKIWVIGGSSGRQDNRKNDIWSSEDGITWSLVTDEAAFTAREGHTSVVFKNKIWVIGGVDINGDYKNDVWSSENGTDWIEETSSAAFTGRFRPTSLVFNDKLWVIGGFGLEANKQNNVWSSDDGITWVEAAIQNPFSRLYNHASVVFNNKMWIIGNGSNSTWSSVDGSTWVEETNAAQFRARNRFPSVVFDNKMWIIGGSAGGPRLNDVWSSEDGISWLEVDSEVPFTGREFHTSVVFNNKIWVIAGRDINSINDVWAFD